MDGPVKNPNRTGCKTSRQLKFQQIQGSLLLVRKVALDQEAYANEAIGVKSLKIQGLSLCNEGVIVDGPVNNPSRTGCNACNRSPQYIEVSESSRLTVARKKGCTRSSSICMRMKLEV